MKSARFARTTVLVAGMCVHSGCGEGIRDTEEMSETDIDETLVANDFADVESMEGGDPYEEAEQPVVAGLPEASCFRRPLNNYPVNDACLGFLSRNPDFENKRHAADDACAPAGTVVYAAGAGKVMYARAHGTCPNWGHLIAIEHRLRGNGGSAVTLYGHTVPTVAEGTVVTKGQAIGTIGHYACWADHVHFGVATRDWGVAQGTYPAWVYGYFPNDATPVAPYADPVPFVDARSNCPPTVGPHTYTQSGLTRTVTVNYDDPEGIAPTVKRIQYQYVNALGQTRFASADMVLSAGQAGRGTYRFSANIAGVQFKFYTEWRDNAGGFDARYPTAGLIE